MEKVIKQSWQFKQPPEEVWAYLTNPDLIEQWLTKTDFRPIVGNKFQFFDKTGKITSCEVLEVNPFTKLSYSWQYFSAKDQHCFDSKVIWTLVKKGSGTELHLEHNGFTHPEDFTAHTNGWNFCLSRMINHINQSFYA